MHRRWIQPLLAELCSGLSDEDLPAALAGLLADSALVRSAALAALPSQPSLEAGECPADDAVTAVLWLAQHDPSTGAFEAWYLKDILSKARACFLRKSASQDAACLHAAFEVLLMPHLCLVPGICAGNAEEATNLWESAGCELQPTFTGALMPYLGHRSEDVRGAAAEALAAGLQVWHVLMTSRPSCSQRVYISIGIHLNVFPTLASLRQYVTGQYDC